MVRIPTPLAICVVAALSLAGCGRKGPLEPPSSTAAVPASRAAPVDPAIAERRQTVLLQNQDNPGLIQSPNTVYEVPASEKLETQVAKPPRPINGTPPPPPAKPFFLDPLLN